jgi:hypothetical protein
MKMQLFQRISTAAILGVSMLSLAIAPANAAACRDAHGRFTKCPASTTAVARPAHATKAANAAAKHEKTAGAAPSAKMANASSAAKASHAGKKAAAPHAG